MLHWLQEPALLLCSLNSSFRLLTALFLAFLYPVPLASASDLELLASTMIQSRADRCIDLNDHGQLRGHVTRGKEEASGWP
jgi:hypothetical protein